MPSPWPFRARARPAPISGAPAQRNTAGRAGSRRLQARSRPAPQVMTTGPARDSLDAVYPPRGRRGGPPGARPARWGGRAGGGGFAHAPVVMANEAHDGLRRCVRTRRVGVRMVRAAHEAGVRRLAMEALPWQPDGTPGPFRDIPEQGGYLEQPDMRTLMTAALDL